MYKAMWNVDYYFINFYRENILRLFNIHLEKEDTMWVVYSELRKMGNRAVYGVPWFGLDRSGRSGTNWLIMR